MSPTGEAEGAERSEMEGREKPMTATITCPACGHAAVETIPTDHCLFFYECKGCKMVLRPKAGDCCVFCSYSDVGCPCARGREMTTYRNQALHPYGRYGN
jgi:hypothetical protein